jgi:hypothetical protein
MHWMVLHRPVELAVLIRIEQLVGHDPCDRESSGDAVTFRTRQLLERRTIPNAGPGIVSYRDQ